MVQVSTHPQPIRGPIAFLCEGTHDAAFLLAVLRSGGIAPNPDFPFFRQTDRGFQQFAGHAYGDGALAGMLRNVASDLDADPFVGERLRGIVIVCDSGERPTTTLRRMKRVSADAGFAAPARSGVWSVRTAARPPLAIVLLPGPDRPGGLETLCREYIAAARPDIARCVDDFFQCVPPFEPPRTREKHDKAAFVCATAALERDEPSLTLARAFSGGRPLVDVAHVAFASVAESLRSLLDDSPDGRLSRS